MEIINTVTKDGLHLAGFLSEPNSSKENIIVHIHGMAGDPYTNAWYPYFHKLFPQNRIAFLVGNHRGTGSITMFEKDPDKYPNIGNAFEKFEDCVYDIDAWVKYAKDLGYKKVFIQAHSLGPSKVVYYINTKTPKNIMGLILISPADMLGLIQDSKGKNDFTNLYLEAKKLISEGNSKQLLSNKLWGEYVLSAETYINFFSDASNTAIFNFGRPNLGWDAISRIKLPVLAITGTKDDGIVPCMDPYKAMKILKAELINSPKVTTVVYKGAEHSFEGFEEQIVKDVTEFVLE